jgi:hypothetical protein
MLRTDKTALICDLAETYHVYDYKGLPARTSAALAFGLGPDSRIRRKLSGARASETMLLLAMIADSLAFIAWTKTKDAQKNRNRPKSIYQALTRDPDEDIVAYDTPAEFWAARKELLGG